MFDVGHFKESLDQSAHFPSDSPETFALFIEWLYTKRCDSISSGQVEDDGRNGGGVTKVDNMDIMKLYVLGQMMFLPLLQDCALSLPMDHYQMRFEYPSLRMITYVYENTPEGSGARRFMAETVHSVIKRPFKDAKHELNLKALSALLAGNRELLYDVMVLSGAVKERDWCQGGMSNS